MEEFADPAETSNPIIRRTTDAGHHGMRDGLVQIVGTARRIQLRYQIRTVSYISPSIDLRLQTRVSSIENHLDKLRYNNFSFMFRLRDY